MPIIPTRVANAVTLQTQAISTSTSGVNHIVPAAGANSRVYVVAQSLTAAGTVSVNWQDTSAVVATGAIPLIVNGRISESVETPSFLFATSTLGAGLDLNLSAGIGVFGYVTYFQE